MIVFNGWDLCRVAITIAADCAFALGPLPESFRRPAPPHRRSDPLSQKLGRPRPILLSRLFQPMFFLDRGVHFRQGFGDVFPHPLHLDLSLLTILLNLQDTT
jgi:hypothetical protein